MTTQNHSAKDPISEIKKAEEESAKKVESAKADLEAKLRKKEEELSENLKEFEEGQRTKGVAKLETVKKEAGELFKSKMATTHSEVNKLSSDAKSKQGEAAKDVATHFLTHIKN